MKSATSLISNCVPPHDLQAERSVIGSILRAPDRVHDVIAILRVECFYSDKHQKIYKVISELNASGTPVDPVTIGDSLKAKGWLDDIGGVDALVDMFHETIHAGNAFYYAKIVKDKWVLRNLISTSTEILNTAYSQSSDPGEILALAEKSISGISITGNVRPEIFLRDSITKVISDLSDRAIHKKSAGIPTGFYEIDAAIGGMEPGKLIIAAGRPGMGKSSFASNIAEHVAESHHVLFISLEMEDTEISKRILSGRSGVSAWHMKNGQLKDEQFAKIANASNELAGLKLIIADCPGATMATIASMARHAKAKHDIGLLVIDYLQLITSDLAKSLSEYEKLTEISKSLKHLARSLKIPILCLSQLSRAVEKRDDKKPRMDDLRGSGSIEQDADIIMLIYRPDYYKDDERPGEVDVEIAKHRDGPVCDCLLMWNKDLVRFSNPQTKWTTNGEGF